MTTQRPCSCGGSNENCVRCYGRGFIEGGHGTPDLLAYAYFPPVKYKTYRKMKCCPLCSTLVREDRLQKHMSRRCPLRPGGPATGHAIVQTVHQVCAPNKPARQPEMPRQQFKKVQSKRFLQDSAHQSARQIGNVHVEKPSWGDNLDATKNCGYPAREEGRYGSYPSHDGFDDESKP